MLTLLLGVMASLIAAEVYTWLPRLSEWLVASHASKLPEHLRERMLEEWRALLQDQPGNFAKLVIAVDLFRARRRVHVEHASSTSTDQPSLASAWSRNRHLLAGDLVLCALAACGAFYLRFEAFPLEELETTLVVVALFKPIVLHAFGAYRRFWRYATIHDLALLVLAVSAGSAAVAVVLLISAAIGIGKFSVVVLLLDWVLSLSLIVGLHLSVRVLHVSRTSRKDA